MGDWKESLMEYGNIEKLDNYVRRNKEMKSRLREVDKEDVFIENFI
jgi:hypothetical protein